MKTSKGTELELINLKGKQYLPVAQRLIWFREDKPTWGIETQIMAEKDSAMARAVIKDDAGKIIATAHKTETLKGFPDYIEKAETGAVGRALALCGYGTQFALSDLDEGERIVDAPVGGVKSESQLRYEAKHTPVVKEAKPLITPQDPRIAGPLGEYVVKFGKYSNQRLCDIDRYDLDSYLNYMETKISVDKKEPSAGLKELLDKASMYLSANQALKPETQDDVDKINKELADSSADITESDIPF